MEENKQSKNVLNKNNGNGRGLSTLRRKKRRYIRYGDDPLGYYMKNCYPMSCVELLTNGYRGLYGALGRKGLLKHVPRKKRDYCGDPLGYYIENCYPMSRGELLTKGHIGLYHALRRKRQLKYILLYKDRENKNLIDSLSLKTLLSEHTSDKSQKERNSLLEQILTM